MIGVAVKDGVILEASFVRGCPGNSIGVAKLVQDMTVEEAISRLKGIDCSERGTSCPDQLAKVLEKCK
ncbi:MAG: TIGR03905 family TSCPD domain-containing protein [Bacteroidales bacterium]|nr:TIGR03905 family TSCPD domain-containing protein [Bacteroidales bacterium]